MSNNYKPDDVLLNEAVFRLGVAKDFNITSFNVQTDSQWDEVLGDFEIDIRDAYITLFPSNSWELKIGRQVFSSWGTGDLVFANDLFPKDWKSFFIGRDTDYLSLPVNAAKFSLFTGFGDLDAVIVPTFTPDNYIDGERLSYWGPNGLTGDNMNVEQPAQTLANAEYYFRLKKRIFWLVESALYAYKGFFKRPLGLDPEQKELFFPELAVYGFSARSPGPGGIFNIESSFYDSLDDREGTDPMIENSLIKTILGFETKVTRELEIELQYFSEWMLDYDEYKKDIQAIEQAVLREEYHDWITLRLTNLHKQQRLILSFFGSYSPKGKDWYLRPIVAYNINAYLEMTVGANMFFGEHDYTSFGQLQENTNVYFRIRYSY